MQTFEQFAEAARAAGYPTVLQRDWAPDTVVGSHTHPFAVQALVVAGELWLTVGQDTRHLKAGDRFSLDAEVPHAERYGRAGASFWVGRR